MTLEEFSAMLEAVLLEVECDECEYPGQWFYGRKCHNCRGTHYVPTPFGEKICSLMEGQLSRMLKDRLD